MSMTYETGLSPASSTVAPSVASAQLNGLPEDVAAWLHARHEQLSCELARAQSASDLSVEDEPTIAVEALPQATRQFLWRGIQQHHPALAELVRDPLIAEARAVFGAQLRLYVADLLTVILDTVRAQHDGRQDHSPRQSRS